MSLPTPNLDDRRFQDIVDEAKRLIPRYCPQWTDHNVSDPGVTLIELFAWMVEMLLFRLNQVPEKNQIAFMELMGVKLLPPSPASAQLTFWLSAPANAPVTIPAGVEVATVQTLTEPAVIFSTDSELVLQPPRLQECLTSPDQRVFADHFWKLDFPNESFPAFSPKPQPGDAWYLGIDQPLSGYAIMLSIDCTIEGIGVNPTNPPLVWEAWCEQGWSEALVDRDETGQPNDTTGGFNRNGQLVLHLPPAMMLFEIRGRRAYWLRCRHTQLRPEQPGYRSSPQIHNIRIGVVGGTVDATQAMVIEHELLGRSDGMPGQSFHLEQTPVLALRDDEVVEVQAANGEWTAWQHRLDFAESLPSHQHFTIDSMSGYVSFGPFIREPDGTGRQYGAIPPHGSQIRFKRYRTGGGVRGNVKAGKLTVLKTTIPYVDRVVNRCDASGGRDGETLEHAKLRAPQLLRTSNRAVTVEDYEFLALQASSNVVRARCLEPQAVGASAIPPGVVQILLVPDVTPRDGRIAPEQLHVPQRTIQDVQSYLDKRRMLTTVVQIRQPDYLGVAVDVRIKTRHHADPEAVRRAAAAKLYQFLNPLVGGMDGSGWPFGSDLHISQVYAVLQGIPGIEYIERINMLLEGTDEPQDRINVPPNSLIASAEHRVVVI